MPKPGDRSDARLEALARSDQPPVDDGWLMAVMRLASVMRPVAALWEELCPVWHEVHLVGIDIEPLGKKSSRTSRHHDDGLCSLGETFEDHPLPIGGREQNRVQRGGDWEG
jgi:hypothetical protein